MYAIFSYNAFVLTMFVLLAWKTNHWWIVFFALLFMARKVRIDNDEGDEDEEQL